MFASGFASLGYQIVWTQQCAIWLGHETAAVLAVVAAFFGGLAIGALALGARIERSAHPARWYAACEAVIAAWSVALAILIDPMGGWLLDAMGAQPGAAWQWTVAFFGTLLLLLPATAAMGATLPAMERVTARMRHAGHSIAALYASNTFGAVAGVLAGAFWLVPSYGLVRSAGLCAAINVVCALAALGLRGAAVARAEPTMAGRGMLARLAATGFLGIGYEVLVVRVLSQVAEDTVYTFAMLLAVYLCGTAAGAAAYQRWLSVTRDGDRLRDHLLGLMALCCLIATGGLWGAEALKEQVLHWAGDGMVAALAAEAALAIAAFGLPTLAMGALFSHLATQARAAGVSFSRALAMNTLGAALAPLFCGVLLVPAIGPKFALLVVAAGYLLLLSPRAWRMPVMWAPAVLAAGVAVWAPTLAFVDIPEGGRIVSYQDGAMASVSVVADATGVMRLRIDNRQQEGSSDSLLADARQALLPLLLHPAPKRALFLGLGTGVTASSAAQDPGLQVDAVELLPEVIAASAHFTKVTAESGPAPRLHTIAADARRYVRASPAQYDVIVSDNFHPARSGSAALYTVEHFRAVKKRLTAEGLFCQWLPLHQLDLPTLRSVVQAFLVAYPDGQAMLATNSLETPVIGLVGRAGPRPQDLPQLRARLASARFSQPVAAFGLADEFAVLGGFVAGPTALARFAGSVIANTDDRPVVAYSAPRITYAPDSSPRERLFALLKELSVAPGDLLGPQADAVDTRRLAAYWAARNRFLEVGRAVRFSGDVERMLAQVREPLLAVLRLSPDFRPAYDPLLRMATVLGRSDPATAGALLDELARLQPSRPEAIEGLRRLGGNRP
jgi:spermidine synthase